MYFEIDDYRPDITPVGRAISWREGVLLSIIVHLVVVILILLFPRLFPFDAKAAQARAALLQQQRERGRHALRVRPAAQRSSGAEAAAAGRRSDKDRVARAPERAPKPTNPLPFSRGNSPERVEALPPPAPARGQGPVAGTGRRDSRRRTTPRVPVPESPVGDAVAGAADARASERRQRPLGRRRAARSATR